MPSSNAIWGRRERAGGSVLVLGFAALLLATRLSGAEYRTYTGCCDGSGAAPVNAELFAVASDEGHLLRLYRRGAGGPPVGELSVRSFLGSRHQAGPDLEAAARLDDLIFWIGSHSRKSDGRGQVARSVMFATAIRGEGTAASLVPVGQPFHDLLDALRTAPALAEFRLDRAAQLPGEARGGLNIEGLCAGPESSLWIGFRNPVPLGRALLVPLLNPREVVFGRPARLGEPARLDLEGQGIRDIARVGDRYLIVSGPAEGGGHHRLFVWSGGSRSPEEVRKGYPRGFSAEGIVVDDVAGTGTAELLADEGGELIGGRRCEDLKDATRRAFRALDVRFREP